ncbi:MAG: hypothetical protein HY903_21520 [Deltaproteobacteria bacterium]|nr:hypothetical protein [Deltaproteobacteria bacterium]
MVITAKDLSTAAARGSGRGRVARAAAVYLAIGLGLGLYAPRAQASERRFTYTYGSEVINAGALELEPWTTFRVGRDGFYNRFDHRLELEVGLTDRLQTAWYFNLKAVTKDEDGGRLTELEWGGVSWEWKYKVLDAVADPIGLGLYLEPGVATGEAELEVKVIVDKRLGSFYTALNAVVEHEWIYANRGKAERELVAEVDVGAAYFVTAAFSAGVEARNHNLFLPGAGWQHAALFAGPVVSYASDAWWATLTVLPQLPALKKGDAGAKLVLDEHERLNVRLLFGVRL